MATNVFRFSAALGFVAWIASWLLLRLDPAPAFLLLGPLVCVPLAVFFPAYALYFMADRYPPLNAVLNPPPPQPPMVPQAVPLPQPIG